MLEATVTRGPYLNSFISTLIPSLSTATGDPSLRTKGHRTEHYTPPSVAHLDLYIFIKRAQNLWLEY